MNNGKYLSILDEIKKHGGDVDSTNPNEKVLIIDGLNTFIRVFSVIPTTNDDGIHIGGIVGFLKSVGYAIKMLAPTRTLIVFDGKGGSNRRRKIYPEYKAKRTTKIRLNRVNDFENLDDERHSMLMQLSRCVEYLECLPVSILSIDNVEADDVIAYAAKQLLPKSKVTIMSTDKDFLQLVSDRISVWSPTKKKLYNPEMITEEYGVTPNNLLMCRIFDGDQSDNIKGVLGIGTKTLLKNFPSMKDGSYYSVEDIIKTAVAKQDTESGNFYKTILEQKDTMFMNRRLMQLQDVDISGSAKLKTNNIVNGKIQELVKMKFQKMFIEDRMFGALPNMDSWLMTVWTKLNRFAKINNG
jgi:DNA polymerase-1